MAADSTLFGGELVRSASAEDAPVSPPRSRVPSGRLLCWMLVGLAVAAGLALRILILGRQPVSSDVAVVGLMAREILHGHFFAFYWGQRYGGGEPYVVAGVFALFGQSSFTLGLTPVLLDAVAALLVWRIGARLFSPRVGVAAALLFWVWPEVYLWQSTVEYGFRFLALACGLVFLLASLHLTSQDGPPRSRLAWWTLLGASLGLGWWCTPEIAYYAIPAGVLLAWSLVRRKVRVRTTEAAAALTAAVVGALPWIWANLHAGSGSLNAAASPETSFWLHLRVLFRYVVPMVLGLRLRASGGWFLAPGATDLTVLGEALYALVLLLLCVWLVVLVARRRAIVLVVFVLCFPLLYAYSPDAWYWQDGRYALYLAPMLALAAVSAADEAARQLLARRRSTARSGLGPVAAPDGPGASPSRRAGRVLVGLPLALVVGGGLALTAVAVTQLAPYRPQTSPGRVRWLSWRADPNGAIQQLARDLEAARATDVYAGYWVSYILDFEARGRVAASDPLYARYLPYLSAVKESPHPGWIFENPALRGQAATAVGNRVLDPGCAALGQRCLAPGGLERYLRRHGVHYRFVEMGDFLLVQPNDRVNPDSVLRASQIG